MDLRFSSKTNMSHLYKRHCNWEFRDIQVWLKSQEAAYDSLQLSISLDSSGFFPAFVCRKTFRQIVWEISSCIVATTTDSPFTMYLRMQVIKACSITFYICTCCDSITFYSLASCWGYLTKANCSQFKEILEMMIKI